MKMKIKKTSPSLFKKLKAMKEPFIPLLHCIKWSTFGTNNISGKLGYIKRKLFPGLPSKYSRVKNLKGVHKGEKCFIVATGPSLTVYDLEMLKGHKSISMNSIILSYDKTDWRPDYYAIQDTSVVGNIYLNTGDSYDLWHNIAPENIIVSDLVADIFPLPGEVVVFRLDMDAHNRYNLNFRKNAKYIRKFTFSDDCFERVFDGYTITYSCIQLAVYMGFTEIYLLGVDCNYTGINDHAFGFDVDETAKLVALNQNELMMRRMTAAYEAAKKYADAHGIKIFNATRGGKLEVFPRISLEEALKD